MLAAHRLGYQVKVLCGYPKMTKAKGRAPMRLVLDERQPSDQRLDWYLLTIEKLDVNSIRFEVGSHLDLINLLRTDYADRSERLKDISVRIGRTRRIHDQAIACSKLLQWRFFPMTELDEAALHAHLDVRPRHYADPEFLLGITVPMSSNVHVYPPPLASTSRALVTRATADYVLFRLNHAPDVMAMVSTTP